MRATCGVMSARRPIMRPEIWSTTLNVRTSRSWPVPVSSESVYSSSGGITSAYPDAANRSRIARRRRSMRAASAGRMSSMYSGSSQRMSDRQREQQQPDEHRGEAEEADLPVRELRDAAEGVAPEARREEGKEPFDDQHQGEGQEERARHEASFLAAGPAAGILQVAEEIRVGLEHQQVVAAAERRAIGLHP